MMTRFGLVLAIVAAVQAVYGSPGATVQVPAGWKSAADSGSTRLNVSGPAGERMVIWPVYVAEPMNAQTAAAMVRKVAAKLDPAVQWSAAPVPAGSMAVRIGGRANGQTAVCSATWVNSPRGAAVYFVLSAAPQAQYTAAVPVFAKIFSSLELPASGAAARRVRWTDPREQAFSMEVPADWRIEGGMVRRAPVDVVMSWAMTAPDGSGRVTGGDAELPTFTLPNQMLAMAGFREGSWYSPGYGVRMMVRQYQPGLMFVRSYVQSKVAQGCSNLQFAQEQDRTRDFAAINAQYAQFRQMGMNVQVTAGEVSFSCVRAGQPVSGYYFATTLATTQMGNNGIWVVDQLYGYTSTGGAEQETASAMSRALESFQFNPQWLQMQQGVTMQTSRIVSQTQTEISRMSRSSFEYRQRGASEGTRKFSNAMLGLVDAVDPVTGRELKVDNAANFHWIDANGRITGAMTDTKPAGIDPRLLVTLP